jgi:hypothetical protein
MPRERVLGFPSASDINMMNMTCGQLKFVMRISEGRFLDSSPFHNMRPCFLLTYSNFLDVVEHEVHELVEPLELTSDFTATVEFHGNFFVEVSRDSKRIESARE